MKIGSVKLSTKDIVVGVIVFVIVFFGGLFLVRKYTQKTVSTNNVNVENTMQGYSLKPNQAYYNMMANLSGTPSHNGQNFIVRYATKNDDFLTGSSTNPNNESENLSEHKTPTTLSYSTEYSKSLISKITYKLVKVVKTKDNHVKIVLKPVSITSNPTKTSQQEINPQELNNSDITLTREHKINKK